MAKSQDKNKADDRERRLLFEAVRTRDARFDGQFFVGVKTTGIYCRPICPARPKIENIEFFKHAALAEKSGFRPCKRCRPESAPASPAWSGTSATVQRALRSIEDLSALEMNEDEFAGHFGMTARHLRRLFEEQLGRSPRQLMLDQRLNFARKLVTETDLKITELAHVSGFASLRRFNDAFQKRFDQPPRELRKDHETPKTRDEAAPNFQLRLAYRPPMDFAHALHFFRHHLIAGVETITTDTYARIFRNGKTDGRFEVSHDPKSANLILKVWSPDPGVLFGLAHNVRQMFDLNSDPLLIEAELSKHGPLKALIRKSPGLRVARGYDAFEALITTILGQLVSVKMARQLVSDLVANYGEKAPSWTSDKPQFYFPKPEVLAKSDLKALRTTEKRKAAIREVATRVLNGKIQIDPLADPDVFKKQVLEISGIGPWSSEYMAIRAFGHPDSFPGSDLILKRALEKYKTLKLENLSPWRSYAAIHFWEHLAPRPKDLGGPT